MEDLIQQFWPSVADFIGAKMKAKFRAREIYIDRDIDIAVGHLAKKPLPLPITEDWIDDFVAVLWPTFRAALNRLIKKSVLPAVKKCLPSFLQSVDIDPCSLGETPPKLTPPIKILEGEGDGWLDLELNLDYEGDADIGLVYRGRSVGVKRLTFKMTLYMSFYGFLPKPPFFHGFSMYMTKPPEISLCWGGILEFLDMHFLEHLIVKIITDALGNMMLLPNRYAIAIASPMEYNIFAMQRPKPRGLLNITLLEAEGLVGNEYDLTTFYTGELSTDPFVTITIGADTFRSSTLWNDCHPKWEDGESSHLFLIDLAHGQQVQIHVYDDGLVQHLRTKANIGSAESDEIARNLNLSILELLGRPAWDPLEEEILTEKWVNLDSWWVGRGMGPDPEDYCSHHEHPKQEVKKGGFFGKAMQWAKDKLKNRIERHDKEQKDKLLEAKARVRLRAHWRHVGLGTPAARPTSRESTVAAAAVGKAGTATIQKVVQSAGAQFPQHTSQALVPVGSSAGAQLPHAYPASISQALVPVGSAAAAAGTLQQQLANARRFQVLLPAQVPRAFVPQPMMQMLGPQPVKAAFAGRKQPFMLTYGPSSQFGTPSAPGSSRQPLALPGAQAQALALLDATRHSNAAVSEASGLDSAAEDEWDRWPTYVLRVGISTLEKVSCPQEDTQTKFFVTCDAVPIVTADGKEVAVTTEGTTTHTTKKRPPVKRSVAGLALSLEESEVLARKVGIMLMNGCDMETIADVLDIDQKTATKILGIAMAEKSGCRDVIFDQSFVYLVRQPELVELELEVFSEVPKQEPSPLGSTTLEVKKVLKSDDLLLESRRLTLDGATSARIDVQCQLWPVLNSGVPVKTLIERATAAERLAEQALGRGVKMAVWVYRARDLRNTDLFGGKSDPYCVGSLESDGRKVKTTEVFRTEYIDDEPNPDWDFGPVTVEWNGERLLRFEVYDKDLVGRGDKLGEATLSREQCLQGLFTDLDLGEGNGTLRIKVARLCGETPVEVPYSAPKARPKLQVWILSAGGLQGVNTFGGKSDPYAICSLNSDKSFQTPVINDELDPQWDHGPEELTLATELELKFEVRDKDMIGSTSLGTATLTRDQCLAGFDGTLRLGKQKGTLRVKVSPVRPGFEPPSVKIDVSVLSAKDLKRSDLFGYGKSDPYVMCKVHGHTAFQTPVIWSELSPEWNHGPEEVDLKHERELLFEVYDKDLFRQGDLLGAVRLDRQRCLAGFEGDLELGKGHGTLRVRVGPASPASKRTSKEAPGGSAGVQADFSGSPFAQARRMYPHFFDAAWRYLVALSVCGRDICSHQSHSPASKPATPQKDSKQSGL